MFYSNNCNKMATIEEPIIDGDIDFTQHQFTMKAKKYESKLAWTKAFWPSVVDM